ncbi:hypothetical protein DYB32_000821 [Aphanomyces invadans]|uniref:Uncharacterized protein n=1 Tax=Aphanomyces invadans TaxID=157072 RepID=A0A3R6ZWN3_9STRA|nr:hypothetical protein DYB32_000821 [Aphanomyces invadans]
MSDPLLCKYAYKPCTNPRVAKKDGDLHRLCEFHRDKANAVQKIYATRRRRERRSQRLQILVQRLLGTIEPVPFDSPGQPEDEHKASEERELIEAELAGLLDDEKNNKGADDPDIDDDLSSHWSAEDDGDRDEEKEHALRRLPPSHRTL